MTAPCSPADLLRRCFDAAVEAVQPERTLAGALAAQRAPDRPVWMVSAGKAAPGMARALVRWARSHGQEPAGGLVIGADGATQEHPALSLLIGDHPLPGPGSIAAADALDALVAAIPADAEVHIALSGGASALMAGPLPGISVADLQSAYALLLTSGLDIDEMNAVRKRISRWSAGRLALALAPRRVLVWLISDVPGDGPSVIASGPCSGDPWTSSRVQALVTERGLMQCLSPGVVAALGTETLKPEDPAFADTHVTVVAGNRVARDAAVATAQELGCHAWPLDRMLSGDAADAGRRAARDIAAAAARWRDIAEQRGDSPLGSGFRPVVLVLGGETTVSVNGSQGTGGRCQELALAAAELLRDIEIPVTLLAAGTDGRDGPTDAAGAIVDRTTWGRIAAAGIDPDAALSRHDAYTALDAGTALFRTGPTGTNVMDLVLIAVGTP